MATAVYVGAALLVSSLFRVYWDATMVDTCMDATTLLSCMPACNWQSTATSKHAACASQSTPQAASSPITLLSVALPIGRSLAPKTPMEASCVIGTFCAIEYKFLESLAAHRYSLSVNHETVHTFACYLVELAQG